MTDFEELVLLGITCILGLLFCIFCALALIYKQKK